MPVLFVLLLVAPTGLVSPAPAAARDAFVGTWKVVVTPDEDARQGGAKEVKDTFTFKGMQFESAAWKSKGFEAAEYTEDTRAGIAATFKSEVKSKKGEGTATWTGTSTGSEITGEMVWKKADGTELHFTFKGPRETR
jgi:hypothetical protein